MRRSVAIVGVVVVYMFMVPERADANFWHWLDDLSGPRYSGISTQWRLYCFVHSDEKLKPEAAVAVGGTFGVCKPEPTTVKRHGSIDLNVAYGWDGKHGGDHDNRIAMIGPSLTVTPGLFLDIAAGAGVAWFTSSTAPSSTRVYLEPIRFDVRPAAAWKAGADGTGFWKNRWWLAATIRLGAVTFPQGFEPGSFQPAGQDPSPRYRAEFIRYVNFIFDLDAVLSRAHKH